MAWVRLDDTFPEHPKVQTLPAEAFVLYITSLCYANRNLTDGYLPAVAVQQMGRLKHKRLAQTLVMAGLWEVVRGGYRIHDYLHFQPTREVVLKKRERDRVRKGFRAEATRNPAAPYPSRTQVSKETSTREEGGYEDPRVVQILKGTRPGRLA